MRKLFICSLCRNGILGGTLLLDEASLTYKTGKVSVDPKYRNLALPLADITEITWKGGILPIATVRMQSGEAYTFLIFGKSRFMKHYQALRGN